MKLAFCADCHLGNHRRHGGPVEASLNRRCREALGVLGRAYRLAASLGCTGFYVLGDLFDSQRPEPQLVAEVQSILASERNLVATLLVGNHDQTSTARGDHALGPLSPVATIVESPYAAPCVPGDVEVALVPFRPGSPASEWLPAELGARWPIGSKRGPRVLCLHMGVSDEATAPWLKGAPDSIDVASLAALAARYGFEHVFAGNWHDRRSWDVWVQDPGDPTDGRSVSVLQLGALVPTGWDNLGLDGYGTVAVWDDEGGRPSVTVHEVQGPRFLKLTGSAAAVDAQLRALPLEQWRSLYVQAVVPPGDVSAASAALLDGLGFPGEVLAEAGDALVEARTAATAARCADTLEAALAGFVREMPLSVVLDGPDAEEQEAALRADVLSEAKRYIAAGA